MSKLKSKNFIMIIIFLFVINLISLHAVGFEDMFGFAVGPGLNIPVGEWAESLDSGPSGMISFYKTLPIQKIFEFSAGIEVPTTNIENYSFIEIPISFNLLFPFSIENASSAYAGLGPSGSINISHLRNVDTETKFRAGYNLQLGYLFAPEHWQYTFIDLKMKYSQFFINGSDIRNLDILIGIGLKM